MGILPSDVCLRNTAISDFPLSGWRSGASLGFEDIGGLARTSVRGSGGSSPGNFFLINKLYFDAFLCTLAPYFHSQYTSFVPPKTVVYFPDKLGIVTLKN